MPGHQLPSTSRRAPWAKAEHDLRVTSLTFVFPFVSGELRCFTPDCYSGIIHLSDVQFR